MGAHPKHEGGDWHAVVLGERQVQRMRRTVGSARPHWTEGRPRLHVNERRRSLLGEHTAYEGLPPGFDAHLGKARGDASQVAHGEVGLGPWERRLELVHDLVVELPLDVVHLPREQLALCER